MNILIIGTTDILGGAAFISWSIKMALEKRGDNVFMFVADKRSEDPKVKIIPRIKWRKIVGFLLGTENLIYTDWILETEEFKKADIIHCHNLHGRFFNLKTLQKMSLIKPVVWTLHDEWAITPHCACTMENDKIVNGLYACPSIDTPPRILWNNSKKLTEWKKQVYKNSILNIVTPSEWLRKRVNNTILSKQNIFLIPNGVDTNIFKKIDKHDARKKLNLPDNKKIIITIADNAKNNPWKGWEYTKTVTNKLKTKGDTLFLSIGNNEEKIDGNIIYRAYINDSSELASYYSAADVLLFTSVAENFPLVILEAMSCGLPIVSFNVGGVKEVLVHKENGYIAKYKDANDLVTGINWTLNLSKTEIDTITRKSADKIAEKFDISKMINNYMELYSSILKK